MYKTIGHENISVKEWSYFIENNKEGNIFQTPEMYDVYNSTRNYKPVFIGIVDERGELEATLLSVIQREFGWWPFSIFSSRCVTWGGPILRDGLSSEERGHITDIILQEQNRLVRNRSIYMEFRNLWDTSSLRKVFKNNGYSYEEHLDILIDLTKGEENLWKDMNKYRRRDIKKSIKNGLEFFEYPRKKSLDEFYDIINITYEKAKIPLVDISHFEKARDILGKRGMVKFFYAEKDGEILAVRASLIYKDMIYDWYAGSTENGKKHHANEFIVWNIWLWGIEHGYKIFDFGGAGNPNKPYGPREFKLRFGGKVVNYGRYQNVFKKRMLRIAKKGLEILGKIR